MALRDEPAERVGEGERVLGVGVDDEGGETDGRGGGVVAELVEGNVKDGGAGLAQVAVGDVAGDSDDFVERLVCSALKGAADGVLAGEEGSGEGFADDGGSGRGVFGAEVAAGEERDLHGGEPARGNVEEPGGSGAGWRAVNGDFAIDADAPEKRPSGDGDGVDAGDGTERVGGLVPDDGELALSGNGFEQEQAVGGEA